jgi:hypothetical protein
MSATVEGVPGNSDKSHARNTSVVRRESTALHDSHVIDPLRHSKLYRDYERTFGAATDSALALRPVEFFGLPFHGKKNENAFCALLADCKSSCSLYEIYPSRNTRFAISMPVTPSTQRWQVRPD